MFSCKNFLMNDTERVKRLVKFEQNFSELVNEYVPKFQVAVRSNLDSIGRAIFDEGIKHYSPETGRWYDPFGLPDCVLDFLYIMEREGISIDNKVMTFATLMYHDSGYPRREDSADYATKSVGEIHARAGALKAMADLHLFSREDKLDAEENFLFSRKQLMEVVSSVLMHDDKFNDHPIVQKMFRDMDNIFIPGFVSTYKDFVSRYARPLSVENGRNMGGEDFLRFRQSYFFESGEDEKLGQKILITPESDRVFREAEKKKLPIELETTKEILAMRMLARTDEMKGGLFELAYNGDWKGFEPLAMHYLSSAIDAAEQGKSYERLEYGKVLEDKLRV